MDENSSPDKGKSKGKSKVESNDAGTEKVTGNSAGKDAESDARLDWEKVDTRYDPDAGLLLFDKRIDTLINPRTGESFDRLVLESVDWVNVVALDSQRRSVMIRQYRFGVGYTTLETPGGMVDPGESSRQAAVRELLEETGYVSNNWRYLGAVEPNPAFHNHLCHHWLAEDVRLQSEQTLGAGEAIEVELLAADDVRAAVASGELRHALALSALARVLPLWPLPFVHAPEPAKE